MADLERLTHDDFAGRQGERFELPAGAQTWVLDSASLLGAGVDGGRAGFSLVFLGPVEGAVDQGIVEIVHADLGELALFVVPLGPRDGRMRYEAVFT